MVGLSSKAARTFLIAVAVGVLVLHLSFKGEYLIFEKQQSMLCVWKQIQGLWWLWLSFFFPLFEVQFCVNNTGEVWLVFS